VKNIFTALKTLRRVNTRLRENIFTAALKTLREKVTMEYFTMAEFEPTTKSLRNNTIASSSNPYRMYFVTHHCFKIKFENKHQDSENFTTKNTS